MALPFPGLHCPAVPGGPMAVADSALCPGVAISASVPLPCISEDVGKLVLSRGTGSRVVASPWLLREIPAPLCVSWASCLCRKKKLIIILMGPNRVECVDPEFPETLTSEGNAPVQPQELPLPSNHNWPLASPSLCSWAVSQLLEPAGAGQQGSRPLPYPPGADPAENPRGEGSAWVWRAALESVS